MIAHRGVRTHRDGPSVRSSAGIDFPEVVLSTPPALRQLATVVAPHNCRASCERGGPAAQELVALDPRQGAGPRDASGVLREQGRTIIYRGVYEWDGAEAARAYATRMVGLLAPFSNADTARFQVVGGLRRDTFLRDPQAAPSDGADGWWRIEQPVEPSVDQNAGSVDWSHADSTIQRITP